MPESRASRSARATTHGQSRTPEYYIWNSMRERCGNENHKSFASYGGRGIRVCLRWEKFENFLTDMGKRPSPSHSIDRVKNDGNYEPENCRWATAREQTNNRRSCRMVVFQGKRQSVTEAARSVGKHPDIIALRIYKGWDVDKALNTPVRKKRPNGESPRFQESRERYQNIKERRP